MGLLKQPNSQILVLLGGFLLALLGYGLVSDPFYFGPHDGKLYFNLAGLSLERGAFHCGLYQHAYWPPAWIELTASLYRLTTYNPRVLQIFLSLVAVVTGGIVYLWGRREMGHKAGLIAAGLSLGTVYVFKYTSFHQYEIFVGFCLLTASYLTVSSYAQSLTSKWQRSFYGLLAGALITLSVLSAAKTVLVGLAIGVFLLLQAIKRKSFSQLVLYALVGVCVCGLWVQRNMACFNEFIPVTTNGGIVYFMAHNAKSELTGYVDPYTVDSEITPESIARHESSRWYALGNQYIVENPGKTVLQAVKKFFLFFNPHYADQFVVFLLSLFVLWRRLFKKIEFSRGALWWIGVPVSIALLHSMYHLESRYIVPLWPFLSLFAAQAFVNKVSNKKGEENKP